MEKDIEVKRIRQIKETEVYQIFCKGCKTKHNINTSEKLKGAWLFDGDLQNPSVKPALRIVDKNKVCEFSITKGKITYSEKTTHELRGQIIELPDIKNY